MSPSVEYRGQNIIKVRGYVNRYGAWVEGGILPGRTPAPLMSETPGQIGNINNSIASALSMLQVFDFAGLYYLPGTASHTGNVDGDVLVVFVKERQVLRIYSTGIGRAR